MSATGCTLLVTLLDSLLLHVKTCLSLPRRSYLLVRNQTGHLITAAPGHDLSHFGVSVTSEHVGWSAPPAFRDGKPGRASSRFGGVVQAIYMSLGVEFPLERTRKTSNGHIGV